MQLREQNIALTVVARPLRRELRLRLFVDKQRDLCLPRGKFHFLKDIPRF